VSTNRGLQRVWNDDILACYRTRKSWKLLSTMVTQRHTNFWERWHGCCRRRLCSQCCSQCTINISQQCRLRLSSHFHCSNHRLYSDRIWISRVTVIAVLYFNEDIIVICFHSPEARCNATPPQLSTICAAFSKPIHETVMNKNWPIAFSCYLRHLY